jgi:hypothetical protein
MRTNRESGFPYLVIGVGFGLLAAILWSSRSRIQWDQLRQGTQDGLDYLSREGEKLRASADELAGRTKEWLTHFSKSLHRETKQGGNTNSGDSPKFD